MPQLPAPPAVESWSKRVRGALGRRNLRICRDLHVLSVREVCLDGYNAGTSTHLSSLSFSDRCARPSSPVKFSVLRSFDASDRT